LAFLAREGGGYELGPGTSVGEVALWVGEKTERLQGIQISFFDLGSPGVSWVGESPVG
jgi:hypothetical protein